MGSASGFVTRLTHRWMELNRRHDAGGGVVLEVGAGEGQHLRFVCDSYDKYYLTDSSPQAVDRAKSIHAANQRVVALQLDAHNLLGFGGLGVHPSRLVASCVLMHLSEPEMALVEWRRVVCANGRITIYVPNEDGVLFRLARKLTTERWVKKSGFKGYGLLLAREHPYSSRKLEVLIDYVFRQDSIKKRRFPFYFGPLSFALFTVYEVRLN